MKANWEIGNEEDRKNIEGAVRCLENLNPRMDNGGQNKAVATVGGEQGCGTTAHRKKKEPGELMDWPSLSSEYSVEDNKHQEWNAKTGQAHTRKEKRNATSPPARNTRTRGSRGNSQLRRKTHLAYATRKIVTTWRASDPHYRQFPSWGQSKRYRGQ